LKKYLSRFLKTALISILVIVFACVFYFYQIFQLYPGTLPKIYLYSIRYEPFRKKGIRYLSYVSNISKIYHIYLDKIRIKSRGGWSEDFPKRNFTIELSKKHSLAGLKSDDDWILGASYIDKSFIRNKLSYDLFRSFNIKNITPTCRYVEVYRNFQYWGLYILTERMDCKRLEINKSDTNAYIFKEPPVFIDPDIFSTSNPYIKGDIHHQKHPRLFELNKTDYLEKLRCFIKTSPDSVFYSESKGIHTYFNLDNIVDWHILLLITHNADGTRKNFYLYKREINALFEIVPWDYDHSFGRDGDNEPHSPGIIDVQANTLLNRLLQSHIYKTKLKHRFAALVKSGVLTSENIISMVEKDYRYFKIHVAKNENRWPVDAELFYDNNNFEQEIQLIKNWIPIQINQVSNYVESL